MCFIRVNVFLSSSLSIFRISRRREQRDSESESPSLLSSRDPRSLLLKYSVMRATAFEVGETLDVCELEAGVKLLNTTSSDTEPGKEAEERTPSWVTYNCGP